MSASRPDQPADRPANRPADQPADLREERRQQRRTASREHILDAAEQVFAEHGFHEASLRDIAEQAQYSVGALYTFFEDKDTLYRECFHRRGRQFMDGMRAVLAAPGTAREQLHALADWQVGFFGRHQHFARLVIRGGAIAPPVAEPDADPEIAGNFAAARQLQEALIVRGQRSGEFRGGSPAVLERMFSGLIGAVQATQLDPSPPRGARRPGAVETLLHEVLDSAFLAGR